MPFFYFSNVNLMLTLRVLIVTLHKISVMKAIIIITLTFFSLAINAQNTQLLFSDNPAANNFDGEQMACYDTRASGKEVRENTYLYEVYHENGQLAEIGIIENNQPNGSWEKYNNKGQLIAKTKYKDGVKIGKWIIWNTDGTVLAKGRYNIKGEKKGNWIYWSALDQQYLKKAF